MQYPGLNWQWSEELQEILSRLPLSSAYGQRTFKLKLYTTEEESELHKELHELQLFVDFLKEHQDERSELKTVLQSLPDLSGEVESLISGYALRAEGFLKIKRFFIGLEKGLPLLIPFFFLQEVKVDEVLIVQVLQILDPAQNRLPSFFLDGNFSDSLAQIRQDKNQLLKSLFQVKEDESIQKALKLKNQEENREEERIYQSLSLQLRPLASKIFALCQSLGRLDFLQAKANLAIQFNLCYPQINNSEIISYKGLRHPLVEWNLLNKNRPYQSLNLELPLSTIVLTGANMSGKSIALKSLLINQYLFQTGFFVFAQRASLPLFDSLTLIDEVKQSLEKGLSSFAAEIIALKSFFVENQEGKAFLVLDEFARSTNPVEGGALLKAILSKRKAQKGLTIIATHYEEIAKNAHMHFQIIGLNHLDLDKLNVSLKEGKDPLVLLQENMDYAWRRSDSQQDVPKEARLVAKLLGLDSDLLKAIEENIAKPEEEH